MTDSASRHPSATPTERTEAVDNTESEVALCGCGCDRPRDEIVAETARTMSLNWDQADAIVPTKKADRGSSKSSPPPADIAAALEEVATFLRSQKYAAYAITCDYAREALGPLIALEDNGYRVLREDRVCPVDNDPSSPSAVAQSASSQEVSDA